MENMLYDSLKKLKQKERLEPKIIYLDEKEGKIKEKPLSSLDSSASHLYIKKKAKVNDAKLIHDFIFSFSLKNETNY